MRAKQVAVGLAALTLTITIAATAQNLEISWYAIGGGGGASTADELRLIGSTGQPAAGVMTSGNLTLKGGYWHGVSTNPCASIGEVDFSDIEAMTQCLSGPNGTTLTGSCPCFDLDSSGTVDLADYAVVQFTIATQ